MDYRQPLLVRVLTHMQDFSELVKENSLAPTPVDRTKIPKVYPEQIGECP